MKTTNLLVIFLFLSLGNIADEIETKSQLVVFINSVKTTASSHFEKNALSEIKKIAEESLIEFKVIESSKGLPAEITTIPAIVFVGSAGRSIYQGRYMSFDRIKNFIETSQNISQTDAHNTYSNLALQKIGRANIGVPIKIAQVTGTPPKNYEYKSFLDRSFKIVLKELHGYELKNQLQSNRTDRFFYMDFYPWVSDSGQLFLSAALFSQFHCKVPIWSTEKAPFVGGWKDRDILFQQATVRMEEEIIKQSSHSSIGDSFDGVPDNVKIVTWDELGLKVNEKVKTEKTTSKAEIAREWLVDTSSGHKSFVQFRLAPPNESYSGFVKKIVGEIKFVGEGSAKKMQGNFKVKMDSVTMGDVDLDAAILAKDMLNISAFPVANFDFDIPVNPENFIVYFGRENILDVPGKFTFKDKTISLKAEFSLEPIIKKGVTHLVVKSNFSFNLKDFGLSGAPIDTSGKDFIEFFITLEMVQKQ